jgi:ATP-binding cassette subfamily F protein uup
MTLLSLRGARLAFGGHPLLDDAELSVRAGERVGLIGRNGTGKSTLLKLLAGRIALDEGELQRREGLRIALVEQEPLLAPAASVREAVLRAVSAQHAGTGEIADEREVIRCATQVAEYLDRFGVTAERAPEQCSGGERKRAALAAAFAAEADVLLLDEPTNHLDIEAIERLEALLMRAPTAIVITHDREFLDRTATRIVELDRGQLRSYPGNFARYEELKRAQLEAESAANQRFDKRLAQEEVWIRKGIEARRTRDEGRVQRLERLRAERLLRRDRLGNVNLNLDAGERSGRLVAELHEVSKGYGERVIVNRLSTRIMRGDRIGIIGRNGAGKSTLIRLILALEPPDAGSVRLGTNLNIAYFDQLRVALDPERTVLDTIANGSDWVETGTQRKHVMSYLADFLFAPQRAQAPVKMLSGGERNRLLLARLFARPANLLVLDEPTNDLDIDSLELLEQTLQDYSGTILLVSHDRRFLDNIVTQTLAPEENGRWREYVGGYSDWLAQRRSEVRAESRVEVPKGPAQVAGSAPPARTRLSYNEQRELEALPQKIEALEREQAGLTARMSDAAYYRNPAEQMREDRKRAAQLEQELAEQYARWEALETRRAALELSKR